MILEESVAVCSVVQRLFETDVNIENVFRRFKLCCMTLPFTYVIATFVNSGYSTFPLIKVMVF